MKKGAMQQRFEKVGKGYFSVARRIPKRPKEGLTSEGMVAKIHNVEYKDYKKAHTMVSLVSKYQRILNKIGVPILRGRAAVTKKGKKWRFYILQEAIPKHLLLPNYLRTCGKKEALSLNMQLVAIGKTIIKYNKGTKDKIGIDLGEDLLANLAVIGGKITFFDFYSPYLLANRETIIRDRLEKLPRKDRFINWFRNYEKVFRENFDNLSSFDPEKIMKRIKESFLEARPDLKGSI